MAFTYAYFKLVHIQSDTERELEASYDQGVGRRHQLIEHTTMRPHCQSHGVPYFMPTRSNDGRMGGLFFGQTKTGWWTETSCLCTFIPPPPFTKAFGLLAGEMERERTNERKGE
mmetsp:Transcript_13005/g.25477  ORF Transcript_13005/g.25477 Transcript_13005/m.25477 type:complete len:114 (+) Transcript_13005:311-652(+)